MLVEAMSTSQVAYAISEDLSYTRDQLIRMHHLGMIEPVGIRLERDSPTRLIGYFRDIVWGLTVHAKEHSKIEVGCRACTTRVLLLGGAEALIE